MRILLSNDDGIFAPGLATLRAAVADLGEVSVVAPDSPQSAAGHSITIKEPLTVRPVQVAGPDGWSGLSVAGRPADCVRLAIRKLLDEPPDLVLSGINAGLNVGVNVFYSGTVAAAAEAAMLGIRAVAFSAPANVSANAADLEPIGRLCRWVLDELLAAGLTAGDLMNVNIPDLKQGRVRGLQVVAQSTAEIEDIYHVEQAGDGGESYRLGDEYTFTGEQANTDVVRLAEGYITVTPLHIDMTNHDRLAALGRHRWGALPA